MRNVHSGKQNCNCKAKKNAGHCAIYFNQELRVEFPLKKNKKELRVHYNHYQMNTNLCTCRPKFVHVSTESTIRWVPPIIIIMKIFILKLSFQLDALSLLSVSLKN